MMRRVLVLIVCLWCFLGAGCYGDYVGESMNENGNPCETYEYRNGPQVTRCDQSNQNPPFRR